MQKILGPVDCFFRINLIYIVIIVFFVEFIQNDSAIAEKEPQKCIELMDPTNSEELNALRLCIKKIKANKAADKKRNIIRNAYQGSIVLTEKLNFIHGKKSPQITSEKLEN